MDGPYLDMHTPRGQRNVPLGQPGALPLTIGRHADNRLPVLDTLASRFHCVIEQTPEGLRIRDLDSSNGTLLNGVPIKAAPLKPGDIVTIGDTTLKLVAPDEPDNVEELTEADLVVDDALSPRAFAESLEAAIAAEEVLPIIHNEAEVEAPVDVNYSKTLHLLAESLPDRPFGLAEIALVSSRGQTVHPAGSATGRKHGDAVDVLRQILLICSRSRATDIHVEPKNDQFLLRIRIDGSLIDATRLPRETGVRLCALVKILCDIDVTQRTVIQEGHFASQMPLPGPAGGAGQRRVDYRVSLAPAVFGQKLVIRIFDAANAPLRMNDLHLPDWMLTHVQAQLHREAGMLLVCGPTGSGKTTTLYALVRSSDVKASNVVTIEDPVEVQLAGVTQIQVNESEGKTFSTLLRSVLRQDPDAILVGEIRDSETARTAMQAAITGHLVFSTVHTTDTAGTIFRLLDLGVEPYLLAQGLHVILAQRLVRQLCRFCRKPVALTPEQRQRMGPAAQGVVEIYLPGGCPRCLGTGYAGRRAFFELLNASDELRNTIVKVPSLEEIKQVLAKTRFVPLEQSGYELVAEGAATITEIEHAVGK